MNATMLNRETMYVRKNGKNVMAWCSDQIRNKSILKYSRALASKYLMEDGCLICPAYQIQKNPLTWLRKVLHTVINHSPKIHYLISVDIPILTILSYKACKLDTTLTITCNKFCGKYKTWFLISSRWQPYWLKCTP